MADRVLADRYAIQRKLGEGGMAEVFLVHDALERRPLALKLLKPGDPGRDYFMHEFQVLARLDHPHLVRVHDLQTLREGGQDTCFYTCELLEGRDLFQATRDMDWDGLYEVTRQVLEALAYIHDRGLVHYDVKPENVNVAVVPPARPGGRPSFRVKLMDFGLTGEATTRRGEKIKGTVHYVAPEVAKSLPADRRADLYSLGISLYYVVTGRLPYDGGSALSIIRKHLERVPDPPTQVRPDVPEAWARFILRLIEKDPSRRPASAHEALADLSRRLAKPYAAIERASTQVLAPAFVGRAALLDRLVELLPEPVPSDAPFEPESTEAPALALAPAALASAPPRPPSPTPSPTPSVVWLEGEEGLGKTRLVYELRVRAQLAAVPVLDATCLGEGGRPFERLVRMALMLPGARTLAAGYLPELEALFPGTAARLDAPAALLSPGPGDDPRLVLDRVAELLLRIGRQRPFLLVLEDLRGADETTLALAGALLRSIAVRRRRSRVPLVVLTDRPGAAPPALDAALDLLRGQAALLRVALERLDPAATGAMVASMLALPGAPPELGRAVHEATGGNPFFVEELVKSLAEDGVLGLRRAALGPEALEKVVAPRSLAELLGQRLARVPDDARALLVGLAALDAPARLKVVAGAADRTPAACLDALDLLIRRQMVVRQDDEDAGPPRYRLSHGLVQRAVLEQTPRAALVEAHRRALVALEAQHPEGERGPVLERLARHAAEGGDGPRALAYATAAGLEALARGRPQQAIEHLGRALERLRWEEVVAGPDERRRQEVTLLTRLSEALATVGRYKDAARALEELLALGAQPGGDRAADRGADGGATVWVRRRLGDLALRQGDAAQARRWLQEALAAADGGSPAQRAERARVLEVMSRMTLWRGDYLQVIALAGEAADVFRGLGRQADAQWALHILATAEHYRGRLDRSADLLDECLTLVRRGARGFVGVLQRQGYDEQVQAELDLDLRRLLDRPALRREAGDGLGIVLSFSELGTCFDTRAEAPAAIRFYEATLEAMERLGDAQRTALSLNNLGVYRRHTGRLAQALDDLERSLAIHEGTGDRQGAAVALLNLALLRLALGDHDGALLRARRALSIARDLGLTWLTGHCHRALGRGLHLQGAAADEADRELQRAVGVFGMIGNARALGDALLDQAEIAAATGRADHAQQLLGRARGPGDEGRGQDALCRHRLLEGALLLGREPARALDALEAALRHAARAGAQELQLEAHRALAHAHVTLGTTRAAQEHHDRSIDLADALFAGLDDDLRERAGRTPGAVKARATARMLMERMLEG